MLAVRLPGGKVGCTTMNQGQVLPTCVAEEIFRMCLKQSDVEDGVRAT